MDYFITLNDKSIDAIGEAVEKPITVIEGLKSTIAEQAETIVDKDAEIEGLEEEIAELEEQALVMLPIKITANNPTASPIDVYVPSTQMQNGSPYVGITNPTIPANLPSGRFQILNSKVLIHNKAGLMATINLMNYRLSEAVGCSAVFTGTTLRISNVTADEISIHLVHN